VFDVESLRQQCPIIGNDFSWSLEFRSCFKKLTSRSSNAVVKLLFVSYGQGRYLGIPEDLRQQDVTVNIDASRRA
jgi:hypothetical protein